MSSFKSFSASPIIGSLGSAKADDPKGPRNGDPYASECMDGGAGFTSGMGLGSAVRSHPPNRASIDSTPPGGGSSPAPHEDPGDLAIGTDSVNPPRPTLGGLDDVELALRSKSGSVEDFAELVRRYETPLFQFLRLRTGRREDAEELTQETLVRAWSKIDRYDPKHAFATWVYTIARRLAVSHLRRRGRRVAEVPTPTDASLDERVGTALEPGVELGELEERERIWSFAVQVLNTEQSTALWLRYVEDLPAEEIGRILGRRSGAVRALLFRARQLLAPRLEQVLDGRLRPDAQSPGPKTRNEPSPTLAITPMVEDPRSTFSG